MREKLENDIKIAMKEKDKLRLTTLRELKGSIRNDEINGKKELNDSEFSSVVMKEIKVRKDANNDFEKAGREDLLNKNREEINILEEYLPEMMNEEEIRNIVSEAISGIHANSMSDIGKIMKEVAPKVKGKADMGLVNSVVKEMLSSL